jgi:hypothetical protein
MIIATIDFKVADVKNSAVDDVRLRQICMEKMEEFLDSICFNPHLDMVYVTKFRIE